MLAILGPAKTIDMSPGGVQAGNSYPVFLKEAEELVVELRKFRVSELKSIMGVSDKLATLAFERFSSWKGNYGPDEARHAILAFSGEVFNGLQARAMNTEDLDFARDHVRILSGLYGVLRPLDLILPYRLEMGTKIAICGQRNLYEFWKDRIPEAISKECAAREPKVLINLASGEYFKSIRPATFSHRIITPVFKESDGDGYRNVTIYAKKARGMMLRFLIKNRIEDPELLKAFDTEGYAFNSHLSGDEQWVFSR